MSSHTQKKSTSTSAPNITPKIIFEDKNLLVVVKPQNLSIQPDRNSTFSLLTLLEDYFEFSRGVEDPFIGLVHRLDRHTGGICIFAKTQATLKKLNKAFSNHKVEKRYLAVVSDPNNNLNNSGKLVHHLTINSKTNFVTASTTSAPDTVKASLQYKKIAHLNSTYGPLSLIEVTLETGRQHQIRVQLASIGYPVMGDAKYGECPIKGESLALWAYRLDIDAHHFISMPTLDNSYFELFKAYFFETKLEECLI